ncbi:MAG: hypothetical protein AAB403_06435 [Planctomycetota bacterium]
MPPDNWAGYVAVVSAAIALVALYFSAKAAGTQARVADFNNCLEVVKQLGEAQRKVRDANDDAGRLFEFRELLNLLEALAKLYNDRKLQSSTREYVEPFIIESWAWLRSQPEMEPLIASSITGDETYSDILRFAKAHEKRIAALALAYRELATQPKHPA